MADLSQQIDQARKSGYSDAEITSFLGQNHPELAPKIKEATGHGYAPGEILGYLSQAPPAPQDKGFLSTLGSDLMDAPKKAMDFLSGHPLDDVRAAGAALTQGRQQAWQQAKDAYSKGNYKEAAEHALFSFPILGPGLNAAANEMRVPEGGQQADATHQDVPGQGWAHAAENIAPFVLPELARGVPALAETAGNAGAALSAGVKAAAPDVAAGAGKVVAGEAVGVIPGVGWPGRMALGYQGVRQVAKGAGKGIEAGKAAIADRMAAATVDAMKARVEAAGNDAPPVGPAGSTPPAAPDVTAGGLTQQEMEDVLAKRADARAAARRQVAAREAQPPAPAAQANTQALPVGPYELAAQQRAAQEAVSGAPATAAPAEDTALMDQLAQGLTGNPKMTFAQSPPNVQGIVRTAISRKGATPESLTAAEAPVQSQAPPLPSVNGSQAVTRESLFNEMKKSGTIPENAKPGEPIATSKETDTEPFKQKARAERSEGSDTLADLMTKHGIPAEDAPSVEIQHWKALADASGVKWPESVTAQRKLVFDTIQKMKDLEAAAK